MREAQADLYITNPVAAESAPDDSSARADWSVHLARRDPRKLVVVVPCVVLTGLAAASVFGSWLAGIGAALVLAFAIGDYLLPMRFSLDRRGASMSCGLSRHFIAWDKVRRVDVAGDIIKLSPLAEGSRLEPYRGVKLHVTDNKAEVLDVIAAVAAHIMLPHEQAHGQ